MSDVFISYKREDKARVETLYSLLLDLDVPVWFDAGIEVGMEWETRILDQIEKAKAVIVCWSFAAVSSHWVLREAQIGLDRGILVPVTIHPCSLVSPFDALQRWLMWQGVSAECRSEATEVPITSYSKSASIALSLSTLMVRAQLMREAMRRYRE